MAIHHRTWPSHPAIAWLLGMVLLSGGVFALSHAAFKDQAAFAGESIPSELLPPMAGASAPPAVNQGSFQGPALETPREILEMLDQRKKALERKEETLRLAEARLASLKSEIEQILAQHEQAVKTTEATRQAEAATKQKQAKVESDSRQASLGQLAKMYETMPPEEAAARLEKMPQERALQLLRLLKGKTAGAILALVKADKAAKLTERYMTAKP